MWDVFKKREGQAVAAGSLELKDRGISCSGWKVRILCRSAEKMVDG